MKARAASPVRIWRCWARRRPWSALWPCSGELLGDGPALDAATQPQEPDGPAATTIAFGYAINLFAVPLLALADHWALAAVLIIAERWLGVRASDLARDAMLSHASSQTGLGWGFGLHEALDQTGAILGPLILSAILAHDYGYREAFGILVVPALLSISVLLAARYLFPRPRDLDLAPEALEAKGLPPVFWVYMLAIAFIAAGYADYALIAFHFDKSGLVPAAWIPAPLRDRDGEPTPSPRWRSDGRSTGSACGRWSPRPSPPPPRRRWCFWETSGWRPSAWRCGDSAWALRNW